jgi:PAS domain S-box-containing protein
LSVDIDEGKKAEHRLRHSEAYLAEAQRLSRNGAAAYTETEILYWSEEASRIWGLDQLQGVPSREAVWQRIHPDDLERVNENIQRGVREKRRFENEFRITLPDGTVKHLEATNNPAFSESGELFVVTVVDVTERKRAEQGLRESELKLRRIIETVPSMLWSTDPNGEPTRVNQRVLDYAGIRFEDFLNLGWKEFLHPDDFPETARAFFHAIQTGEPYEAVHRLRRVDGQYRWHHARGEPLRDREGQIVQWYGLSVDIDERKRAEDGLRRSEAYLAEAERLSHSGSAAYSETEILYFSEEARRMYGFDPLQGIPSREAVWQRIHPDDRDRTNKLVERAVREKRSFRNELRVILPDGTIRHQEAINYPVFSPTGEFIEIVVTGVDVTERKRADDALRRGEAYLAEAERLSHTGGWAVNRKGEREIAYWSAESYRIFGFDPSLGMPTRDRVWQRIHPDDRSGLREAADAALRERKDYVAAFRISFPDGTIKHLESNARHSFSADGELLEVMGTFVDVTERKRAEEALRESERSARSAIDGIGGLVAIMAPNGELDALNRQGIEYFGRSLEEMKGWATSDAVHPEDLPRIAEIVQRSLAIGAPFQYELRLRRFDGEYRWFENRGVPTREKSGSVARWYILGTDIEDRKQAETALRTAQAELAHVGRVMTLGQLTASIAHEVNQPIGSARNYAEAALNFLNRNPPEIGEVRGALDRIVAAADRAGGIVDRIRDQIKKAPPENRCAWTGRARSWRRRPIPKSPCSWRRGSDPARPGAGLQRTLAGSGSGRPRSGDTRSGSRTGPATARRTRAPAHPPPRRARGCPDPTWHSRADCGSGPHGPVHGRRAEGR